MGRRCHPRGAAARGPPGARRMRAGRCPARRGPPPAVDHRCPPRGEGLMAAPPPSVALLWGDDELATTRAVERLAEAHAGEGGVPLERWELRGDTGSPGELVGQI